MEEKVSGDNQDIVIIEGEKIGYQLNKRSMGERKIRCRVHCKDGFPYCHYKGMRLACVPVGNSTQYYVAVHQLQERDR